jgi:hypothetical protein
VVPEGNLVKAGLNVGVQTQRLRLVPEPGKPEDGPVQEMLGEIRALFDDEMVR